MLSTAASIYFSFSAKTFSIPFLTVSPLVTLFFLQYLSNFSLNSLLILTVRFLEFGSFSLGLPVLGLTIFTSLYALHLLYFMPCIKSSVIFNNL
uniref:Uncharacterized protein n=1 Tax=Podoviridae sp. ctW0z17 TaxID=2825254 RepID=A0A8S5UXL5_9CAUD|nr:MAG TPA: hypothetical protein [Podoviridae sp. ctW0z17]